MPHKLPWGPPLETLRSIHVTGGRGGGRRNAGLGDGDGEGEGHLPRSFRARVQPEPAEGCCTAAAGVFLAAAGALVADFAAAGDRVGFALLTAAAALLMRLDIVAGLAAEGELRATSCVVDRGQQSGGGHA